MGRIPVTEGAGTLSLVVGILDDKGKLRPSGAVRAQVVIDGQPQTVILNGDQLFVWRTSFSR